MSERLYNELESYLLHDINKDLSVAFEDELQGRISKNYVIHRMNTILDIAEQIELNVKDANSIYGLYDIDWEERRRKWLISRGLCYQMIAQLKHISTITLKGTNLDKYVRLSNNADVIANKIKNVMIADDKKRKKGLSL